MATDGEWVCDAYLEAVEGVCAYCGQLVEDHEPDEDPEA
jgi:hypothetical protein